MEELIQKYIPIWVFHPKEQVYPMRIDTYVSFSKLRLAEGEVVSTDNFSDWVAATPPEQQVPTTLVPNLQKMVLGIDHNEEAAPVYVFYIEEGEDIYITYYLFYRSNPAPYCILGCQCCCGYHDADLEHVQVHLRNRVLERVYYSKHSGGNWVGKEDLVTEDGKPVVYVALGSHACYERPGMFLRIGGLVPDYAGGGLKMVPTQYEVIQGVLLYRGCYGNGSVSGFPSKANWMKEDVNEPWRC